MLVQYANEVSTYARRESVWRSEKSHFQFIFTESDEKLIHENGFFFSSAFFIVLLLTADVGWMLGPLGVHLKLSLLHSAPPSPDNDESMEKQENHFTKFKKSENSRAWNNNKLQTAMERDFPQIVPTGSARHYRWDELRLCAEARRLSKATRVDRQDQINYLLKTPAACRSPDLRRTSRKILRQALKTNSNESLLKTNFPPSNGKTSPKTFPEANQHWKC